MDVNKTFYTLPHKRSSSAATRSEHSGAALKRQSFSGHMDESTKVAEPLLTSGLSVSPRPAAAVGDGDRSGTSPHKTSLSSDEISHSSEVTSRKHQMATSLEEDTADEELSLLTGHQKKTEGRGGGLTLPRETFPLASTTFILPVPTTQRHSVPAHTHDIAEQLQPLMPSAEQLQPLMLAVRDKGQRFHETSSNRMSVPHTTTAQPLEAALDRYHSLGHTARTARHLEPVVLSGSSPAPSHRPFSDEGTSAFRQSPHQARELPVPRKFNSAATLEKYSSPSHRADISHEPHFTPGTSAKDSLGLAGASATLPYHIPSSSSPPTTLQSSRVTTDSIPSTSSAVKNTQPLEPFFTTQSSHSGSEKCSDKISRQTSASYATSLHLQGLASETPLSPTHTAELMLSGGLPMNRRRPGTSPESQHVTMRGTITRGNSVGQPVKVQLDLTETEFRRLTSKEPAVKEEFKCGCGRTRGPHIILWSLLCIPVAIVISLCVAFYNGSLAWYNLFIYFSEERTVFHKVVLCPVIILTFPLTVGVSAVLISLVAAAMQISWSWHRWLAEVRDGEKGFYGWFCGQIGLPRCSPYQVVVLDSSSV